MRRIVGKGRGLTLRHVVAGRFFDFIALFNPSRRDTSKAEAPDANDGPEAWKDRTRGTEPANERRRGNMTAYTSCARQETDKKDVEAVKVKFQ